MKLTIDEKVCLKHKMTVPEVLAALSVRMSENHEQMMENLFNREILVQHNDKTYLTQSWSEVIDDIICDSSGTVIDEGRLTNLAKMMRECFPQGKMRDKFGRDTPYYYRCNNSEVIKKLKKFFTQFGNYSDDDIISATKRYVASFNGNYAGMRLIKYFILKDAVKQGEEGNHVEQVSDLLTFLENRESEEEVVINNDDWLTNSRN